jgi:signal peptidase I
MSETLDNGDIVVSVKTADLETGDIVAFYYNNTILVKRVIGHSGDWIDIDKDGTVSVNREVLEEPYLDRKAYGEIDIKLPYQVPEGRIFVMGDNREISIDSRTMMIGCVAEEQIVGKIIYRVWPFDKLGGIK